MKRTGPLLMPKTNTRSRKLSDRGVERREFLRRVTATTVLLAGSLPDGPAFAGAVSSPRRIDIHHHFVPPLFGQTARERNLLNPLLNGFSVGRSIEEMDR